MPTLKYSPVINTGEEAVETVEVNVAVVVNSDDGNRVNIADISPLSEPAVARISAQTKKSLDASVDNATRVGIAARILDIPPCLEGVSIPVHASESLFEDGYGSDGLMAVNYDMDRELKELEVYNKIEVGVEGVRNEELVPPGIVGGEGDDTNGDTFILLTDEEILKFKVDTLRKELKRRQLTVSEKKANWWID